MKKVGERVKHYVLSDTSWKVDFPAFMKEVCEGSKTTPYAVTFRILNNVMSILAERAIELNDPALNIIMMRLALYEGAHSDAGKEVVCKMQDEIKQYDNLPKATMD